MGEHGAMAKSGESPAETKFFLVVLLIALVAFGYLLWGFATDLVLGFLIASACRSLHERFAHRLGGRAWLSAALITLGVAIVVAIPCVYLVTALSRQAATAYSAVHDSLSLSAVDQALEPHGWVGSRLSPIMRALGNPYDPDQLRHAMSDGASKAAAWLTPQLNALVSNLFSLLYHFAMMLIVVFYALLDGPAIKRRVFDLSPLPDEEEELIVLKFRDVWSAILIGNGVGSLLQGAVAGLAMWFCGLPSPLLWTVIMTVFAFLPLIGISVVVVPATIYLFIVDRVVAAVLFFAFCTVTSFTIENVLKTKLMGDRLQMHNLLIFFSVLGGLSVFGIAGVLYGPLLVSFVFTVIDLYERVYRARVFPESV